MRVAITVAVDVAVTMTIGIVIALLSLILLEDNQGQWKDLNQNASPEVRFVCASKTETGVTATKKFRLNLRIIHFILSLVANKIHLEMEKESNS